MRFMAGGSWVLAVGLVVVGCASQPADEPASEDPGFEELERESEEAQEELERETAD